MQRTVLLVLAMLAGGCPTVDLGEEPVSPGTCRPSPSYFQDVIWPEFVAPADTAKSCVSEAGCHRTSDGRSSWRVSVVEPIDFASNYQATTRFLQCGAYEASSLLTRPLTGVDSHGGGDLFGQADPQYDTFLMWFSAP